MIDIKVKNEIIELKVGQYWQYYKNNESITIEIKQVYNDGSVDGIVLESSIIYIKGQNFPTGKNINQSPDWIFLKESEGIFCFSCKFLYKNAKNNYYRDFICWKCDIIGLTK